LEIHFLSVSELFRQNHLGVLEFITVRQGSNSGPSKNFFQYVIVHLNKLGLTIPSTHYYLMLTHGTPNGFQQTPHLTLKLTSQQSS